MTQPISPDRLRHPLRLEFWSVTAYSNHQTLHNLVTSALCLALLLYTGRTG